MTAASAGLSWLAAPLTDYNTRSQTHALPTRQAAAIAKREEELARKKERDALEVRLFLLPCNQKPASVRVCGCVGLGCVGLGFWGESMPF